MLGTGCRKLMASGTSCALSSNSVPGKQLELVVDLHAMQLLDLAAAARILLRQHRW